MRLQSYRLLFQLLSFLSDKTNGKSYIVKYKLLIGTLIIGLSSSCSSTSSPNKSPEKAPTDIDIDEIHRITCYDPALPTPDENSSPKDTTTIKFIPPTIVEEEEIEIIDETICYMQILIEEVKNDSIS